MSDIPRLLGGRYEVGDLIGRGGMAEVHMGHDTRLGRTVAIKLLRADLARDPSFISRFRREAQSAAGLNHASIVAVYDHGEDRSSDANGSAVDVPYIVMEFVDGETLRQYLGERGHLDPKEAARITEGVLDALAYSHQMGIAHRDIKPANVMLARDGTVKVMDFGIARAIADTNATMTQTQAVIGTAQYLSPEQAQGQHIDARSDLYSTGCLLFELLTGRPPFTGDSPVSIAYQHVGEIPPAPSTLEPGIPLAMDDIVAHALVKDRDGRYQDAAAFRADLTAFRLGRALSPAAAGMSARAAAAAAATQAMPAFGVGGDTTALAALPPVAPVSDALIDEEPPRRRTGAYILLVLAVLAVLGLLAWGAKTYLASNPAAPATKVLVPQVTGLNKTQAETILGQHRLQWQENLVADQAPKDQVIRQSEPPGTYVDPSTKINLDVSTGPNQSAVPDVSNDDVQSATTALVQAGFVVAPKAVDKNDSPYPAGKVDSTNPPAGTALAQGSTVTLIVSTGNVTVPNVVGLNQADAYNKLALAGLNVSQQTQQSSTTPGNVISQTPNQGLAPRGSQVVIVVAIPVTPTPTPTTTTTTTPPPTTTSSPSPTTTTTPPSGHPTGKP